jgi:hypothetical protein
MRSEGMYVAWIGARADSNLTRFRILWIAVVGSLAGLST